ncbi:MAG: hypothetical protein AAFN74_21950, partial [Myxococcota bacterium]
DAVIERVFRELRQSLTEAMNSEGTFEQRLDALIIGFDRHLAQRPQAAQLVLREVLDNRGQGHEILLAGAVPLLEMVEAFVADAAETHVDDLAVREAIMTIASSRFVRASGGRLTEPMWGLVADPAAIVRRLFLKR